MSTGDLYGKNLLLNKEGTLHYVDEYDMICVNCARLVYAERSYVTDAFEFCLELILIDGEVDYQPAINCFLNTPLYPGEPNYLYFCTKFGSLSWRDVILRLSSVSTNNIQNDITVHIKFDSWEHEVDSKFNPYNVLDSYRKI